MRGIAEVKLKEARKNDAIVKKIGSHYDLLSFKASSKFSIMTGQRN